MIQPAFEILNQRGTPMFFSDVFANRPTAGIVGRIFISTDTKEFYRDTGSTWELLAGPGGGTITGSGTINTFAIFTGSSTIGDSSYLTQSTNQIIVSNANFVLPANNVISGTNYGISQSMATNDTWRIFGNTLATDQGELVIELSDNGQPISTNGQRFRFSYNATSSGINKDALIIDYDTSTFTNKVIVNNTTADAGIQIVGNNSPSLRIDNAVTGATQRFVMGLATATNNFIQGSAAGNICISTASANPLLFGMWQTINASEVMRITTANNLLVGSSVDNGIRFQVTGSGYFQDSIGISSTTLTGYKMFIGGSQTGGGNTTALAIQTNIQSDVLGFGVMFGTYPSVVNAAFTMNELTHFTASFNTKGALATINNQYGFLAQNTLTAATNNFGFYGNISSGTNRWNIYMNGTANNYMAGRLAIGSTAVIGTRLLTNRLNLTGGTTAIAYEYEGAVQSDVTLEARGFSSFIGTTGTFTLSRLKHFQASASSTFSATISQQFGYFVDAGIIGATNNFAFWGDIPSGTGRWNIYMNGAGANYMAGNLLLGSTTNTGQLLYVNGTIRIDGQRSATAGGSSGQHLIINCDGTTYKIALLNN